MGGNVNVDKTWELVKESISEAATKVLGKKNPRQNYGSIGFVKKPCKKEN